MTRNILLVVPDLFFAARIREAAAAAGARVTELPTARDADEAVARGADLAIVDLAGGDAAAEEVRALRRTSPDLRIIGFYAHVDAAARDAALAAGADDVLPRSAFTRRLAGLLSGA